MKTSSHVKISLLWVLILLNILSVSPNLTNICFLLIGVNLPDFDLIDYVALVILRKILFLIGCNGLYNKISKDSLIRKRKILWSSLLFAISILILITFNNLEYIFIVILVSFFIHMPHKQFTHSILGWIVLNVALLPVYKIGQASCIYLSLGYIFHIIQDLHAPNKMRLFYPFKKKVTLVHREATLLEKNIEKVSIVLLLFIIIVRYLIL